MFSLVIKFSCEADVSIAAMNMIPIQYLKLPQSFLEDSTRVLEETGLEQSIGIVAYTDGVVGLGCTVDRENITVFQDKKEPIPKMHGPSAWASFKA